MSTIETKLALLPDEPDYAQLIKDSIRESLGDELASLPPFIANRVVDASANALNLSSEDLLIEIFSINPVLNHSLVDTEATKKDSTLSSYFFRKIRLYQRDGIEKRNAQIQALNEMRSVYAARTIQPELRRIMGYQESDPPQFHNIHEKTVFHRAVELAAKGASVYQL